MGVNLEVFGQKLPYPGCSFESSFCWAYLFWSNLFAFDNNKICCSARAGINLSLDEDSRFWGSQTYCQYPEQYVLSDY